MVLMDETKKVKKGVDFMTIHYHNKGMGMLHLPKILRVSGIRFCIFEPPQPLHG